MVGKNGASEWPTTQDIDECCGNWHSPTSKMEISTALLKMLFKDRKDFDGVIRRGGWVKECSDGADEVLILGETFRIYQFPLLELCEYLHEYKNGSLEDYSSIRPFVAERYLVWRLSKWNDNKDPFSKSVKHLIHTVLAEPYIVPAATEEQAQKEMDKLSPLYWDFNDMF